jgi:hypothetical protein
MGGHGSGRHYRWDTKTVLEECRSIDVRDWKRRRMLREGTGFSWAWWRDNVKTANIQVFILSSSVRLVCRYRKNGGEWRDVDEIISLVTTPCHFGGERIWFRCPSCSKRAAKLYSASAYFRCQRCCRAPYASQQETDLDRANRKARKLRRKLNDDGGIGDPIWKKPKGMHWRTFERLREKVERQDEIANGAFIAHAARLIGWERLMR